MTARCVIVRHGNTFGPGEEPRRIGARTDLPLVESGRAQAERLGAFFAREGWRFDRILAGPLRRTRETAALIATALPDAPRVETVEWLAEVDHGPDENRTEAEVTARIGEAALAAWDAHATVPPGWQADAAQRGAAWRAFFGNAMDAALLVTSNGAARFALLADPGLARQAEALSSLKLATGAFGVIGLGAGGPQLEDWNRRP